jgi:hypothetical protein
MRVGIACAGLMVAIVLCRPPEVRAATVIETLTGTLGESTDVSGMFVGKGANLSGLPFKLVYTLDTVGGVSYYQNPTACDNGRINSGLKTPIPRAVLTINGKSYTFGVLPPGSIYSWVTAGTATSPRNVSNIYMSANFPYTFGSMYGYEYCSAEISLDSIPIDQSCRNWADGFNYNLKPPLDVGEGEWTIQHSTLQNPQLQEALGYLTVANINVSGPITPPLAPHIFFFDTFKGKTVDATETPQSVFVGQKIQLFAVPAGSGVTQPWEVKDIQGNPAKLVEGYTTPPIPIAYISRDQNSTAIVTPVNSATFSDPTTTTFYWVTPGATTPSTYEVTYHYTKTDGKSTSVVAKFEVDGPIATAENVTTTPAAPQTHPVNIYNLSHTIEFGTEGIFPANGITFNQNAIRPQKTNGYFFWTQLISVNGSYVINGVTHSSPVETLGLDNAFPFAPACSSNEAVDSPSTQIPTSYSEYHQKTFASMYLMWNAGNSWGEPAPNTIPVSLGFVPWFVEADVVQTNGVLSPKSPPLAGQGGAQSLFVPITSSSLPDPAKGFPQWDHPNINANSSVKPCP